MKKTYSVLSCATFLACVFAAGMSGCSNDESNEKVDGAAGRKPKNAAAAGTTSQSRGGGGGSLLTGLGGVTSLGQAGGAGLPSVSREGGAINTAGAAGAFAGIAGAAPSVAGAAPKTFSRITATIADPIVRVVEGKSTPIKVTIHRDGSDYGVVNVAVDRPPSATNADPVAIPDLANTAELQFSAQTSADKGGPYPLTIIASSADDPSISAKIQASVYVTGKSGSPDVGFGVGGKTTVKVTPQTTETTAPTDYAQDLVVDSRHRVILGGHSFGAKKTGWVVRLSANGAPDTTLDSDGKLDNYGQLGSSVRHLALVKDQLFVAASQQAESSVGIHFVRKLTEDGLSDQSFNGGFDFNKLDNEANAMEPFNDGVVVAAGQPMVISGAGNYVETFKAPDTLADVSTLAVDWNNQLLYAKPLGAAGSFEIGRLLGNGAADTTFGIGGSVKVPCPDTLGQYAERVQALLVAPNMLITALVNCALENGRYIEPWGSALVSLTSRGSNAQGVGVGGTQIVGTTGAALSGIIQSDGKLVVLLHEYSLDGGTSYKLKRFGSTDTRAELDGTFATAGVLDLTAAIPSIYPNRIAYDAAAERVVLVASEPSGAITVYRFWL